MTFQSRNQPPYFHMDTVKPLCCTAACFLFIYICDLLFYPFSLQLSLFSLHCFCWCCFLFFSFPLVFLPLHLLLLLGPLHFCFTKSGSDNIQTQQRTYARMAGRNPLKAVLKSTPADKTLSPLSDQSRHQTNYSLAVFAVPDCVHTLCTESADLQQRKSSVCGKDHAKWRSKGNLVAFCSVVVKCLSSSVFHVWMLTEWIFQYGLIVV